MPQPVDPEAVLEAGLQIIRAEVEGYRAKVLGADGRPGRFLEAAEATTVRQYVAVLLDACAKRKKDAADLGELTGDELLEEVRRLCGEMGLELVPREQR